MKLFLYSMNFSSTHARVLTELVGKKPAEISFALIENAADVEEGSESWLEGFRAPLEAQGFDIELVDLRKFIEAKDELKQKLGSKDVIWIGGGNTFYLRWILKESGADTIINELVKKGKVYAGWSAGAVIAGPSLKYIDKMDDPKVAPEVIWEGLGLVDFIVVPHKDNDHFAVSGKQANNSLKEEGNNTYFIADHEAVVVNDLEVEII